MTLDLSPDIRKSVLPERQRLLERLLLPLNRRLAADITLPIRTLDIDPPLLYEALRYYHQHPRPGASSRPRMDWHPCSTGSSPGYSRPAGDGDARSPEAPTRPACNANRVSRCCNAVARRFVVGDERPDNAQTRVRSVRPPGGSYPLAQGRAGRCPPSP